MRAVVFLVHERKHFFGTVSFNKKYYVFRFKKDPITNNARASRVPCYSIVNFVDPHS